MGEWGTIGKWAGPFSWFTGSRVMCSACLFQAARNSTTSPVQNQGTQLISSSDTTGSISLLHRPFETTLGLLGLVNFAGLPSSVG